MIGLIALGFIPTYAALEVGTRKLAKRMSVSVFLDRDSKSSGNKEMKINGL